MKSIFVVLLLIFIFSSYTAAATAEADDEFDVREHLSTVTGYPAGKKANLVNYVPSTVPEGCNAIHLNLVARHGTRAPTKKRIKELDQLESRLATLLDLANHDAEDNMALEKIPKWLWEWQSPWKGRKKGGELISKGEDELYQLGVRVRERFTKLFEEDYHPDIYSIRASQVPRASASAVAFGLGLLSGKGSLGLGHHRAFAVMSESRASDIWLRFHDKCETYKKYRLSQEPSVEKLKEPILDSITVALVERYGLNFTRHDTASLWFLCKQEASLLDITNQACGLFNHAEVHLLEWTDDLEVFLLKGYGKSINYRMGAPLLHDVLHTMEQAISAKEENHGIGTYEKARLRFAHAETVIPFTCLLGLFLNESEFEQIQRELPLVLPPTPPEERNWRGSTVAPFGGNNMLVLYHCPSQDTSDLVSAGSQTSNYFVQVLHNELPVPIPGCGYKDFCPFELFKDKIVEPHLKHDFDSLCKMKPEESQALSEAESCSFACRASRFLKRWF